MTTKRTTLTAVERVRVAHLVADYGANFYGRVGGMTFSRGDAVRYTTEGWVCKALPDVETRALWDLVDELLMDDILAAGKLSDAQVDERAAARWQAAQVHEAAALAAHQAGDHAEALRQLDLAELECPDRPAMVSWDTLRGWVREVSAEAGHAGR